MGIKQKYKSILFTICFLVYQIVNAQFFPFSFNQQIPDNNQPFSFDLNISGLPLMADSSFGLHSVCLEINHISSKDLEVKLQSPDGTVTTLFSEIGWNDTSVIYPCLSDSGNPIYWGTTPFNGTYRSMMPLGVFNNHQNPNGTWKLICQDKQANNTGTLVSVSLNFNHQPAKPFSFVSSQLPIILLNTSSSGINNYNKSLVEMKIINGDVINLKTDTVYEYDGYILAEWQGWSSVGNTKKNIDFDLSDLNGIKIDAPLLGMPAENDWVLKSEFVDPTLIKNSLVYELSTDMGVYAPRTRFCEVILNGEYLGLYVLMEKVKRDNNRLNIDKLDVADVEGDNLSGGYIIEMNATGSQPAWYSSFPPINDSTTEYAVEFKFVEPESDEILPVQANYIQQYVTDFETALHDSDLSNTINGYRKYIDVKSFIDFMIINEFSANYDSYGRSTYMYKENNSDGGLLHIGPPWDYDRTFGLDFPSDSGWVWEITNYYWPFPFWWSKLWTDENYKTQAACRWKSFREEILSNERIFDKIDSLTSRVSGSIDANYFLWKEILNAPYNQYIDQMKQLISNRIQWIDHQFEVYHPQLPEFILPDDTTLCFGSMYDASFNGNSFSYNWIPGPDTSVIHFYSSGVYKLRVTDSLGCFRDKKLQVEVIRPDASFNYQYLDGNDLYFFEPLNNDAVSYDWDFGDGVISNQISLEHQYQTNGQYLVQLEVTDSIGCSNIDSTAIHVNTVGIEKIKILSFPNPFVNVITIVSDQSVFGSRIDICDIHGRPLKSFKINQSIISLDLSDFSSGLYIIQSSDGMVRELKIIKR